MNTLGQHIRKIRKSKNLTLKQLSEKADVSVPYLSDIERDAVNPSWKTLQLVARALDLSLPEIVDFNNELENKLIKDNQRLQGIIDSIRLIIPAP